MRNIYNVYDEDAEGALILQNKNHGDLCEFFQIHAFNHAMYTVDGKLYRDRYRIERVKSALPDKLSATPVGDDFEREWRQACARFRNCIWVKQYEEGVRRLVSGTKRQKRC